MKNKLLKLSLLFITFFTICGCKNYKAFTYKVETGDRIRVELDKSNGYNIDGNLPFTITKDNETVSQGSFISLDDYESYINVINNSESNTIISNGKKDGMIYMFYSHNSQEWNYIIKIENTNTAVLLGNIVSQESAEKCFNKLSISLEK